MTKKKEKVSGWVIRRVGESAGDTDEGSESELSEDRFRLCASNLVYVNEGIKFLEGGNCPDDLYEITEPSVQDL